MRIAKYIFLSLALFLLLAHSFVPHAHEFNEEDHSRSITESRQPLNVLAWIVAVFQQDLGEDHLENYQPSSPTFFPVSAAILTSPLSSYQRSGTGLVQMHNYLPYQSPHYHENDQTFTQERGPPVS